MSIRHCIIHGLKSSASNQTVELQLREEELAPEDAVVSLFTQLKQSLQRSATRQYGLFDSEQTDNPMPSWLAKFEKEELGFVSATTKIMEQLKLVLTDFDEPLSAHILFVVEELMEHQYLYLFWVNHSEAQYIDSQLDVGNLSYIDSSKIGFVLKLDFSQWAIKDWQQYLTVQTSRGNANLSHAFMRFSGFVSGVNLQQQTSEFLEIVDQYTETLDKKESNPTKNAIVNYCVEQDMRGNPINFDSLSQVLNESEPEKFSSFVSDNQESPVDEIYAHRNSLKKYVRFYGREKDLSISFSSDRMEDNIVFDPENGSLTFKQVPKSLQAQLANYLKKYQQ